MTSKGALRTAAQRCGPTRCLLQSGTMWPHCKFDNGVPPYMIALTRMHRRRNKSVRGEVPRTPGGQIFFCCLTLLYLSQEQPGLGRTKRPASQHRQLPPKQGHNQRRRITAVGNPPSSDHLANFFEERAACLWSSRCHHRIFR